MLWLQNLAIGGGATAGVTATLTGTLASGVFESELQSKPLEVLATLDGDTFLSGTLFGNAVDDYIQGFDSDGNESLAWNAEVRDKLSTAAIIRLSDNTVLMQLPAISGYAIDSNETVTGTIPASILTGSSAVTASPTVLITANAVGGTDIVNSAAEIEVNSNYEICPVSGVKLYPMGDPISSLVERWDGQYVRRKSLDPRHPQEYVHSRRDHEEGAQSPESDDIFISTTITPESL